MGKISFGGVKKRKKERRDRNGILEPNGFQIIPTSFLALKGEGEKDFKRNGREKKKQGWISDPISEGEKGHIWFLRGKREKRFRGKKNKNSRNPIFFPRGKRPYYFRSDGGGKGSVKKGRIKGERGGDNSIVSVALPISR